MFDIGASELLVIVIVAILVIGPKDMPHAMRTAGRWIGKMRKMSNHFRAGVDEMVRQAEIEDMEEKWAQRNKEIMAKYPTGTEPEGGAPEPLLDGTMEPVDGASSPDHTSSRSDDIHAEADAAAEAAIKRAAPVKSAELDDSTSAQPQPDLPLDSPPVPPKKAD